MPEVEEQIVAWPSIVPDIVGAVFTVTLNVCGVELPQELEAATLTLPLTPAVALIVFVVLAPLQPLGPFHVYDVAPATGETLYTFVLPLQTTLLPLIAAGVAGIVFTVTANVCADDVPHAFVAVTLTEPLVPAVELILLLVPVPLHPPGNVHVYEVALGSFVTEYD